MTDWLASIPDAHLDLAAGLRRYSELRAAFSAGFVWVRGPLLNDDVPEHIRQELRKIPHAQLYRVEAGNLRPENQHLHYGAEPSLDWVAIDEAFTVALPPTALPGTLGQTISEKVALNLVRSGVEMQANLLVTSQDLWLDYIRSCPAVRLVRLTFSHDATTEQVMVRGTPLPPLPGARYHQSNGVALPCGMGWQLPVDATTVRQLVAAGAGDLVLFAADASYELVPARCFVTASRSAVRLTLGEQYHD